MTKSELMQKTNAVIFETRAALQTVYNALNQGQKKKILKDSAIRELFDRYGVQYE